jgi:hypothetical protein
MTDPGMADATYVGPMTPELVEQILDKVGQNMQHLAWKEGICGWLFGGRGAREGCWELRQKGVPMTPELVAQILNKVGQDVYQLAWEAAYLCVFVVCVWGGGGSNDQGRGWDGTSSCIVCAAKPAKPHFLGSASGGLLS